jgi:hypothetical protein
MLSRAHVFQAFLSPVCGLQELLDPRDHLGGVGIDSFEKL